MCSYIWVSGVWLVTLSDCWFLVLRLKKSGKRDDIFLATKFGFIFGEPRPDGRRICGDPEYAAKAIDSSLKRLGVDYVDLWYLHR